MTEQSAAQPLAGLVAVELGTSVAAPTATMILAELGAEVFKVENPKGGDDARAWGPPFHNGDGMNFVAFNRNKRSVAVDLKDKEQCAALRKFIIERADIVVQTCARAWSYSGIGGAMLPSSLGKVSGSTSVTRTPYSETSVAKAWLSASNAHLVAW